VGFRSRLLRGREGECRGNLRAPGRRLDAVRRAMAGGTGAALQRLDRQRDAALAEQIPETKQFCGRISGRACPPVPGLT